MFAELPESLQQQVLAYLEANNFRAAKKLHDDWFNQPQKAASRQSHQPHLICLSLIGFSKKSKKIGIPPLMPLLFKTTHLA